MEVIELEKADSPFKSAKSPQLKAALPIIKLSEIGETFYLAFTYEGQITGQRGKTFINISNDKGEIDPWRGGFIIKNDGLNKVGFSVYFLFATISTTGTAEIFYTVDEKVSYRLELAIER